MKKKLDVKKNSQKRKKQKTSKDDSEKDELPKAEILNAQTLKEGMLLLGCVMEIRSNCFLMSLPGCLVGKVLLTNISTKYTETIMCSTQEESENESVANLDSIIELGTTFPCKVLSISQQEKKKSMVMLSINPQDVNAELRLSSLYLKMVLHAAVQSVEDHGYVMDIGVKNAQGFLPFSASSGKKNLVVGQVIPTSVRKLPSHKNGNVVWLSELSVNESFPEIDDENLKLISLLPGTNVTAYITLFRNPFFYGKCMDFNACANAMSLRNCNQDVTEASKVSGTILYVHPVTRMIYLLLGPKPTPSTFTNFFRVKKFDLLKNVKYQYSFHHRLLFKVHHGPMGFVYENDLTKTEVSTDSLAKNSVVSMARVLFLHYMDNLIHLSFKKSVCESEIIRPEDVQIGDIYEATIKNHSDNGMFVSICVGFGGFVRKLFLSDILVSMPEKLYPVDSKVKCRVISLHPQSGFNMTCKDSLLQLPPEGILKSYDQAHIGQFYKGVIVQKTDTFIVVLFFNDIKGVVPLNYIPQSAVFYEGQTVSCHVIWCEPKRKKLKLSLLGDKQSSNTNTSVMQSKKAKQNKAKKTINPDKDQFDPKKTYKAVIKSITGNQLNIVLDGGLIGRIHITELGCSQENFRPLTEFSAGQKLKVHIIGVNSKRSVNYLAITNRVMKHFCECSLEYPPPVPLERNFHPGMTVMGYIKEISDIAVSLWLSPNQTGTLDYLHFSDNPTILRKLKKKLKVGSSLTANVLDVLEKGDACKISLAKIENKPLEAGFNIVGLVQVASPEKGLIIKLPNGYHGTVSLVDLQDVYVPAKAELQKQHKLRFILCHLLEVNSVSKFCQLSLRKSRLYNLQGNCLKGIEPELTIEDIQQGKKVKGYIKVANSNYFIVNFGRMLDGKVPLHQCSTYGCALCKHCQNAVKKYSIGDVLEVVIESVKASKGLYPLSLPELVGLGANEHSRLNLTEDINWSEM